jgi:dipeptidyl aminopeptidase/acylaminoacyl peptidase
MTRYLVCALALISSAAVAAPAKGLTPRGLTPRGLTPRGLTIDDMLAMQRVDSPAVSPDGKLVAFTVRDTDLAANVGRFDVYVAAVDGSKVTRLTTDPENDTDPAWMPDSKSVWFLSKRGGSSQVWKQPVDGGTAVQVTKLPIDVDGFKPFPDGKRLVLALDVWPDARTLAASAAKDVAESKSKVKAHVYTQLMFRHWDSWEDGKFSHVFVWTPAELGGKADDARDLTPGAQTDAPTKPFGDTGEFSISPDGKTVAYVQRIGASDAAWTTNTDVFLAAADGRTKPVDLTIANKAYDNTPAFSHDGKSLALLAMARPGYESDRNRIVIYDLATRKPRVVTEAWDRSPESLAWSADDKTIFAAADNLGSRTIFAVDVATGTAKSVVDHAHDGDPHVAGNQLVFTRDALDLPAELFTANADGTALKQLTHFNDARVKAIAWGAYEPYTFTGAHGDTVHGMVVKPANWKAGVKYPIAFIIHGGPQGSMANDFHYRWNPEVFAGHGYGVVFVDFHGSTGYGQKFTDAINGDWGGAPYDDLMAGLDAAIAKYPWLDGKRAAALGASYGGYMINWINGKTDRFRALVVHDGNLDEQMAYFDTEELWFPEWEHGGVPWEKPAGYTKANPIDLVKNWKTPTLVIHGGKDFRVVDTQGISTFTALQRKGIPSKLLYFPDENHWVLKPLDSQLWHHEVLAWLDTWTAPRK